MSRVILAVSAAILVTSALMLGNCGGKAPPAVSRANVQATVDRMPDPNVDMSVYRMEDKETGVTCYVMDTYNGGGISCLSRSEVAK